MCLACLVSLSVSSGLEDGVAAISFLLLFAMTWLCDQGAASHAGPKANKANGKIKYFNISSIRPELVPFVVSLSNHEQKISSFDKLRTNESSYWKMECFIFAVRLMFT